MTRLRERESCAWVRALAIAACFWAAPAGAQDWQSVGEVMDASLATHMEEYDIPGAVLTIVLNGEVIYEGTYGMAEVETGRPVTADETLFRLASLSKPFTALAAVQLAGEGRLDLDAPISDYLGEETPPMPLGPVTMRHLLTHTSGFDNTDVGDAALEIADFVSLETYVATRMTPQTSAPGALYRYSNPGFALAGRVIEVVSGQSYADYMRDAVLAPRGMGASTFAQPAPGDGEARLAVGYDEDTGARLPRDFTQTPPADALLATGTDMGRFMIDQLDAIERGTMTDLYRPQFAQGPGIPAEALAWEIRSWRGRQIFSHAGGQLGFTSLVALIPEERLGFFIALNARESAARGAVMGDFIEAFLPRPEEGYGGVAEVATPSDASNFTGTYVSLDYPYGNFERAGALLGLYGQRAAVTNEDGALTINGGRYVEFAPDTFQAESGWPSIWVFERDAASNVSGVFNGRDAFRRQQPYEKPAVLIAALALAFVAGLARGVALPGWSRLRGRPLHSAPLVSVGALATTIALGGTMGAIAWANGGAVQLDYGMPFYLRAVLVFNMGAITLMALAVPGALWSARRYGAGVMTRELLFALLMLPAVFVLPYLGLAAMP